MPRLSLPPTDIRVPTPTGATAPLPAKKPSDALLDTLEGMDPNSDAYKAGLRQYNTLISQGN